SAAQGLDGVARVDSIPGSEGVVVPPPPEVGVEPVAEVGAEVGAVAIVLPLQEGGQADEAALAGREDGAEAWTLRRPRAVGAGGAPGCRCRKQQSHGAQRQRSAPQLTGTAVATSGFSVVRP